MGIADADEVSPMLLLRNARSGSEQGDPLLDQSFIQERRTYAVVADSVQISIDDIAQATPAPSQGGGSHCELPL
jgi:hypothetical protein